MKRSLRTALSVFLGAAILTIGVMSLLAQEEDSPITYTDNSVAYDQLLQFGDPEKGARLFDTFQPEAGFACSTCHRPDSEEMLIGPGMLNILERAEARVEGQTAAQYLFTSIVNPDDYVVEGFSDELMPEIWDDLYSTLEIAHIMAYLATLDESTVSTAQETDTATAPEIGGVDVPTELLASADPARGEALFNTFQPEAGFACATCHRADSEQQLIGPGQLNIGTRAATRVEGQNNIQYIYTSIMNPDAYVVEGFADDLMPENWAEIYTEEEIHDIIAYLLTLEG